jgi:tetratricopeptide (TPR) repeat protein
MKRGFAFLLVFVGMATHLHAQTALEWRDRGIAALVEGKDSLAESAFTKAVQKDPRLTEAWYQRGLLYSKRFSLIDAKNDFQKVVELEPNSILGYYELGNVTNNLEQEQEALGYFNRAINIIEANKLNDSILVAKCYFARGYINTNIGKETLSAPDYLIAVQLDPKNALYRLEIAFMYFKDKKWAEAIEQFTKCLQFLKPSETSLAFLAHHTKCICQNELQQYALALPSCLAAQGLQPKNPEVFEHLGKIYLGLNDTAAACQNFKQAKELGQESAAEWINLYCKKQPADRPTQPAR